MSYNLKVRNLKIRLHDNKKHKHHSKIQVVKVLVTSKSPNLYI